MMEIGFPWLDLVQTGWSFCLGSARVWVLFVRLTTSWPKQLSWKAQIAYISSTFVRGGDVVCF